MHAVELHRAAEGGASDDRPNAGNAARGAGRVRDRRAGARSDARARRAALLQPADVGVPDEPLRVGPRKHDRADALIGLGPRHERGQVRGDRGAELSSRAAIEPSEERPSSLLDLDSGMVLLGHARLLAATTEKPPTNCATGKPRIIETIQGKVGAESDGNSEGPRCFHSGWPLVMTLTGMPAFSNAGWIASFSSGNAVQLDSAPMLASDMRAAYASRGSEDGAEGPACSGPPSGPKVRWWRSAASRRVSRRAQCSPPLVPMERCICGTQERASSYWCCEALLLVEHTWWSRAL